MDADSTYSEAISLTLGGVDAQYAVALECTETCSVLTKCTPYAYIASPQDPSLPHLKVTLALLKLEQAGKLCQSFT